MSNSKSLKPMPVQIGRKTTPEPSTHVDPVCKMLVMPETAAGSLVHEGETYYFCALGCLERFRTDPNKYLSPPQSPEGPLDVEYTCPMHPEIVQVGPGACPI